MATKSTKKRATTPSEPSHQPDDATTPANSSAFSTGELSPVPTTASPSQEQQLAELQELTRSLMAAVQAMNMQNSRNEILRSSIDDVRSDVKAATRAMLLAPAAGAPITEVRPAETESGPCQCECVSQDCCCFEIVLEKMRATAHQIEPADSGEIPFLVNAMEVQIFAEAMGFGILFPSIASFVDLRIDNILFGPGPGAWVYIKQVMNRVCVKKGTTLRCPFSVQIRESDERATEQATLAGKDEFGDASGWIDLNCCVPTIYPEVTTEVSLNYGGKGGGRIQVVIFARRVCC